MLKKSYTVIQQLIKTTRSSSCFSRLMGIASLTACWFVQPALAQDVEWRWGFIGGGTGNDRGLRVRCDQQGNVLMGGEFSTLAYHNPNDATKAISGGGTQLFVFQYSSTSALNWSKNIGGASNDIFNDMVTDAQGDVFVAGYQMGNTNYDNPNNSAALVAGYAAFVAKYGGSDSSFKWVLPFPMLTGISSLATDQQGNLYITGDFEGTENFNPKGTTMNRTSFASRQDAFIAKYNASGICQWANTIGAAEGQSGEKVIVDSDGNIYVVGKNRGTITLPSSLGTLVANQSYNLFVIKYSPDGTVLWGKQFNGDASEEVTDVAVDGNGNLVLSGVFTGTLDFSPGQASGKITANGTGSQKDGFVAVLGKDGALKWGKAIGAIGSSVDKVTGVSFDADGNLFTHGYFNNGTVIIGDLTLNSTKKASYVAKFSPSGESLWAKKIGESESGINLDPAGIAVDKNKNIFLTGAISHANNSSAVYTYESHSATHINAPRSGTNREFYLIKLQEVCQIFKDTTVTVCDSVLFNGKLYKTSGNYADTFSVGGGCDSIVRLALTVNHSVSAAPVVGTYCDSVTFNGETYTQTGVYTQTFSTALGCDSVLTYDVEILHSSPQTDLVETACGMYVYYDTTIDQTGVYTFQYVNQEGCDSIVVLDVTINPIPSATVSANDNALTSDDADSYQWIDCATNTIISGATSKEFVAEASGSYAVIVDIAGCTDTSDCVTVEIEENSVADWNSAQFGEAKVYPNPAGSYLNIQTKLAMHNATVRIVNPFGQTLLEHRSVSGTHVMIDVAQLPHGHYFVVFEEGTARFRKTFVKQ